MSSGFPVAADVVDSERRLMRIHKFYNVLL